MGTLQPSRVRGRHEGMSYRQIAEMVGTVGYQTVANSIVKNLPVEQPETITGKDGRLRLVP